MLTSMTTMMAIMLTQIKHPLAMGLLLLIQTIIIAMITGFTTKSFWFSYILLLIFLGGMLILFIYITSLASNEMFSLSMKMTLTTMILFMMMMTTKNFMPNNNIETMSSSLSPMNVETTTQLMKLYNEPSNLLLLMMGLYLLLTLIVIVNITNISKGPLRQMN
uniref:NADH-ubiquinone oxidoreductase chain 6 n=1 Tax=Lamproblatta sp. LA male TaxID=2093468 RepID=A0A2P1H9I9_9NEOP|nr:NADH dehydrogenase subunit 6 [Lamproblatta sp. LA male]